MPGPTDALEERVAALERTVETLLDPPEVETQCLRVLDGDGNVRACLQDRDGSPSLLLLDSVDKVRVRAMVDVSGEPSLALYDSRGDKRLEFGVANDTPFFTLRDEKGRARLKAFLHEGAPMLCVLDAAGEPRAAMGVQDGEGFIGPINEVRHG